jgi:predicted RNase H-like HicB family nuclease
VSDYHFNIFWSDEDGGYVADIPDLAACSAFGSTPFEALAQVELAKEAWLEAAPAEGKPIPAPSYRPQRHRASWRHSALPQVVRAVAQRGLMHADLPCPAPAVPSGH